MCKSIYFILLALVLVGCHSIPTASVGDVEILKVADVKWEQLNPARGDKSPQAGTLWGDRKGEVPTGFLAKFVDGFSSPPHIHNATYRAAVIKGSIHNDDPDASPMWMPPGSFWTQPKGQVHVTSAKGDVNVALVEIDMGPYLVLPPTAEFDSGERPINVDPSNIVWVDPVSLGGKLTGVKIAYLWGELNNSESNGTFLKIPKGVSIRVQSNNSIFRAVVISGTLGYSSSRVKLEAGSYFSSDRELVHGIRATDDAGCILYIRTQGVYEIQD